MSAPPVARFALAYAAGAGWGIAGAPFWTAPLLVVLYLALPIPTWRVPSRGVCIITAVLGALAAHGTELGSRCTLPAAGESGDLLGRFLVSPLSGSAPFSHRTGCPAVTVVTSDVSFEAGVPLALRGTWMAGRARPWFRASGGTIREAGDGVGSRAAIGWVMVRWRDGLVRRIHRLYGDRGPLVAALTLARREGMDRSLTETFARTGIAHLLAISGFHVGVIAGAMFALLRLAGLGRRRAGLGAAGLAWVYVALIGFPDAACRAALILALVAGSRARGHPPARWGALSTALLILLVLDPSRIASPGFQLSFTGAAGLVAWGRTFTGAIVRATGRRCPRSLASALGAGAAATLATLPVVAWHFERVSLVGIPVTLAATPLVSIALPGAILSLLMDPLSAGVSGFLAGGVDALLGALQWMTGEVAANPWVSAWTSRASVWAGAWGCVLGSLVARHPRVGARGRRALIGTYVTIALIGWPVLARGGGWGSVELVMIDVGQGDAIAIRSPRGRWMLVDTGPAQAAGADPGGHSVLRALRSRGVGRLDVLVLTHADLDHIGGASAVLLRIPVGVVYDPGLIAGKSSYLEVLEAASSAEVRWVAARAGQAIDLDGVAIEVLHPVEGLPVGTETNEASVVLRVSYGEFDALLTGDAYKETDRRLAGEVEGLEVLKVGHHGSNTSTDSLLLARSRPETALVSVGRFNHYGHPAPEVLGRLERAGISVYRTDLAGTISVTGRRDGSYSVRSERGAPFDAPGRTPHR